MTERAVRSRDRWFAPTVLAGVAGAGLAALAGSRTWATARGDAAGIKVDASVTGSESTPLVATLALVALASWGVLLVVRGRVRRAVAALGLLAAVGSVWAGVAGFDDAQDDAVAGLLARGARGDAFEATLTAWYPLALVGAALAAVALAVAVVRSPGWPAMGSRYDAPGTRQSTPVSEDDMWRALDEGRDPTS